MSDLVLAPSHTMRHVQDQLVRLSNMLTHADMRVAFELRRCAAVQESCVEAVRALEERVRAPSTREALPTPAPAALPASMIQQMRDLVSVVFATPPHYHGRPPGGSGKEDA